MGPQYDSIYLRSLLMLYTIDGKSRWYALAAENARRAYANARDSGGVFSRAWDGGPITADDLAPGLLQTDAATVSVFAWLAATPAPNP